MPNDNSEITLSHFAKIACSYEDLTLQLDWAGWKTSWEKYFTRDNNKAKRKKQHLTAFHLHQGFLLKDEYRLV